MLTSDGVSSESPPLLESPGLPDCGVGTDDDWVEDEAVLVALDFAYHLGLVIGRTVVVNDTKTTEESHMDGHGVLGDGVHGRRDERSLQGDSLGDRSVERHGAGREACLNHEPPSYKGLD